MTTTAKPASNGSKETPGAAERLTGMARVEDAMAYHLACIAHDAVFEAERLCTDIHRATSQAYLSGTNVPEASDTQASPAIQHKIGEGLRCLDAAQLYLRSLLANRNDEPPF